MRFFGPDGLELYAAICLRNHLEVFLTHKVIMGTMMGPGHLLQGARAFTQVAYEPSPRGIASALDDMNKWVDTMWASMPVTDESQLTQPKEIQWKNY